MKFSFPHEPAVWLGIVRALVVFGTAFGLQLTAEQTASIYGLTEVLSTVIQRQAVTPNAKLRPETVEQAANVPPGPKP